MATVDWYARAAGEVAGIKADHEQWGPIGDWVRENVINQISWGRYTQSQVNHALAVNGFAQITDWNPQAVERMRQMYQWQGRSREGILHQMMQEGFTNAQINFAAYEVLYDADWNAQAVRAVSNQIEWNNSASRQGIIDNLRWEGFTKSQIEHATAFLDSQNVDWYANAVNAIRNTIDSEWFKDNGTSRRGVTDNLRWSGFTPSQVTHAEAYLDGRNVNWNTQAASAAKNIMDQDWIKDNGISHNGLVRQLNEEWTGFTLPQATHGANSVGAPTAAIWNAQAVIAASRIVTCCCFSHDNSPAEKNRLLIRRLITDQGFDQTQTNHALTVTDGFTRVNNWQTLANQRAVEIKDWWTDNNDIIRELLSSGFTQSQTNVALNAAGIRQVENWQTYANQMAQHFITHGRGFSPRSLTWELIWFGFTRPQAEAAVSSLSGVDWNAQAARRVTQSISGGWATSRQGLINNMVYGDGFTQAQAEQAVQGVAESTWNENAVIRAAQLNRELSETEEPSAGLIISIMIEEEGFTLAQAEHAIFNAATARYIEARRVVQNHFNATWNQGISRDWLLEELQQEWQGFTQSQAEAAVAAEDSPIWNEQAVMRASHIITCCCFAHASGATARNNLLISRLLSDGFTQGQTNHVLSVTPGFTPVSNWQNFANQRAAEMRNNWGWGRDNIIRELLSSGFTQGQTSNALVSIGEAAVNWQSLANQMAQDWIATGHGYAPRSLTQALIWFGFTRAQAEAAVNNLGGVDWNAQAVRRLETYISWGNTGTQQWFIDLLRWDGFTQEQAEHAANSVL
jgi:SOS response regulatory protein OraA/RecX